MSTQAPEQGQPEIEVVTGQVMHVIVKGEGKWQIAVQPQGSQYTKNLWTKDAALVSQMEGSINHHFSFVCGPSYWNMADGKQVRSLWINSVTTPGQVQEQPVIQQPVIQGTQQQPTQQPTSPQQHFPQGLLGLSPMEKEERIMREHAMGVAATMLPYMRPEERNAQGMVVVAEGLIAYYKLGPEAVNGGRAPSAPGYGDEPTVEQSMDQLTQEGLLEETPPVPETDDIPF